MTDEEYTGPVPANFLSVCGGNIKKARAMYAKAKKWYQEKHLDVIFDMPQDNFDTILRLYPHAIHGYSLDGCAVCYEVLGS